MFRDGVRKHHGPPEKIIPKETDTCKMEPPTTQEKQKYFNDIISDYATQNVDLVEHLKRIEDRLAVMEKTAPALMVYNLFKEIKSETDLDFGEYVTQMVAQAELGIKPDLFNISQGVAETKLTKTDSDDSNTVAQIHQLETLLNEEAQIKNRIAQMVTLESETKAAMEIFGTPEMAMAFEMQNKFDTGKFGKINVPLTEASPTMIDQADKLCCSLRTIENCCACKLVKIEGLKSTVEYLSQVMRYAAKHEEDRDKPEIPEAKKAIHDILTNDDLSRLTTTSSPQNASIQKDSQTSYHSRQKDSHTSHASYKSSRPPSLDRERAYGVGNEDKMSYVMDRHIVNYRVDTSTKIPFQRYQNNLNPISSTINPRSIESLLIRGPKTYTNKYNPQNFEDRKNPKSYDIRQNQPKDLEGNDLDNNQPHSFLVTSYNTNTLDADYILYKREELSNSFEFKPEFIKLPADTSGGKFQPNYMNPNTSEHTATTEISSKFNILNTNDLFYSVLIPKSEPKLNEEKTMMNSTQTEPFVSESIVSSKCKVKPVELSESFINSKRSESLEESSSQYTDVSSEQDLISYTVGNVAVFSKNIDQYSEIDRQSSIEEIQSSEFEEQLLYEERNITKDEPLEDQPRSNITKKKRGKIIPNKETAPAVDAKKNTKNKKKVSKENKKELLAEVKTKSDANKNKLVNSNDVKRNTSLNSQEIVRKSKGNVLESEENVPKITSTDEDDTRAKQNVSEEKNIVSKEKIVEFEIESGDSKDSLDLKGFDKDAINFIQSIVSSFIPTSPSRRSDAYVPEDDVADSFLDLTDANVVPTDIVSIREESTSQTALFQHFPFANLNAIVPEITVKYYLTDKITGQEETEVNVEGGEKVYTKIIKPTGVDLMDTPEKFSEVIVKYNVPIPTHMLKERIDENKNQIEKYIPPEKGSDEVTDQKEEEIKKIKSFENEIDVEKFETKYEQHLLWFEQFPKIDAPKKSVHSDSSKIHCTCSSKKCDCLDCSDTKCSLVDHSRYGHIDTSFDSYESKSNAEENPTNSWFEKNSSLEIAHHSFISDEPQCSCSNNSHTLKGGNSKLPLNIEQPCKVECKSNLPCGKYENCANIACTSNFSEVVHNEKSILVGKTPHNSYQMTFMDSHESNPYPEHPEKQTSSNIDKKSPNRALGPESTVKSYDTIKCMKSRLDPKMPLKSKTECDCSTSCKCDKSFHWNLKSKTEVPSVMCQKSNNLNEFKVSCNLDLEQKIDDKNPKHAFEPKSTVESYDTIKCMKSHPDPKLSLKSKTVCDCTSCKCDESFIFNLKSKTEVPFSMCQKSNDSHFKASCKSNLEQKSPLNITNIHTKNMFNQPSLLCQETERNGALPLVVSNTMPDSIKPINNELNCIGKSTICCLSFKSESKEFLTETITFPSICTPIPNNMINLQCSYDKKLTNKEPICVKHEIKKPSIERNLCDFFSTPQSKNEPVCIVNPTIYCKAYKLKQGKPSNFPDSCMSKKISNESLLPDQTSFGASKIHSTCCKSYNYDFRQMTTTCTANKTLLIDENAIGLEKNTFVCCKSYKQTPELNEAKTIPDSSKASSHQSNLPYLPSLVAESLSKTHNKIEQKRSTTDVPPNTPSTQKNSLDSDKNESLVQSTSMEKPVKPPCSLTQSISLRSDVDSIRSYFNSNVQKILEQFNACKCTSENPNEKRILEVLINSLHNISNKSLIQEKLITGMVNKSITVEENAQKISKETWNSIVDKTNNDLTTTGFSSEENKLSNETLIKEKLITGIENKFITVEENIPKIAKEIWDSIVDKAYNDLTATELGLSSEEKNRINPKMEEKQFVEIVEKTSYAESMPIQSFMVGQIINELRNIDKLFLMNQNDKMKTENIEHNQSTFNLENNVNNLIQRLIDKFKNKNFNSNLPSKSLLDDENSNYYKIDSLNTTVFPEKHLQNNLEIIPNELETDIGTDKIVDNKENLHETSHNSNEISLGNKTRSESVPQKMDERPTIKTILNDREINLELQPKAEILSNEKKESLGLSIKTKTVPSPSNDKKNSLQHPPNTKTALNAKKLSLENQTKTISIPNQTKTVTAPNQTQTATLPVKIVPTLPIAKKIISNVKKVIVKKVKPTAVPSKKKVIPNSKKEANENKKSLEQQTKNVNVPAQNVISLKRQTNNATVPDEKVVSLDNRTNVETLTREKQKPKAEKISKQREIIPNKQDFTISKIDENCQTNVNASLINFKDNTTQWSHMTQKIPSTTTNSEIVLKIDTKKSSASTIKSHSSHSTDIEDVLLKASKYSIKSDKKITAPISGFKFNSSREYPIAIKKHQSKISTDNNDKVIMLNSISKTQRNTRQLSNAYIAEKTNSIINRGSSNFEKKITDSKTSNRHSKIFVHDVVINQTCLLTKNNNIASLRGGSFNSLKYKSSSTKSASKFVNERINKYQIEKNNIFDGSSRISTIRGSYQQEVTGLISYYNKLLQEINNKSKKKIVARSQTSLCSLCEKLSDEVSLCSCSSNLS